MSTAKNLDSVEKKQLLVPSYTELSQCIEKSLRSNFASAAVRVVTCPDLSESPWNLAAEGICGSPRLVDIGGVPYLIPLAQKDVRFNFSKVASLIDLPNAFFIGAGAGSCHVIGKNCELMPNLNIGSGKNLTTTALVENENCVLQNYNHHEMGVLCNVLASEGLKDQEVLHITATSRTGKSNFTECIHSAIISQYGDQGVALGGVFVIKSGKAKIHVMPDFSTTPLCSDADVDNWLKFYEMKAPLTCLSTMISADLGLDLRLVHTHCFSEHGEGGHYHYDTTPREVSYEGYFVPAEYVYRIGRPTSTHQIGRD